MVEKPSLSVIIPALDEEGNLEDAMKSVYQAMDQRFSAYEILIFNDGSTDATGRIAETLAARDGNVKVIHNPRTMGFGYNINAGIERARYEYVTMVPGDNEIPSNSIEQLFKHTGPADIVASYFTNQEIRPFYRQILSILYTTVLNLIFGLDMKYYNGPFVYKLEVVKKIPIATGGFAYLASNLVRMLKMGHSFIEVGIPLGKRKYGASKAVTVSNTIVVARTLFLLFLEIYVWERGKFRNKPRRVVEQPT